MTDALGLYHPEHNDHKAWIELFIDKISVGGDPVLCSVPLFYEQQIAQTLFHEIGHHVHFTKLPEFDEREDVADRWQKRLYRRFFRKRYWYLVPVVLPLRFLFGLLPRSLTHLPSN